MIARLRSDRAGRVRFLFKLAPALRMAVRPRRRPRLGPRTVEEAVQLVQYSMLPPAHRRRARAVLRRSARRHPGARHLYASIASPVGTGNDGQRAYDMASRTWFGNFVGSIFSVTHTWLDVTSPTFLGGAKGNGINDDTPPFNAALTSASPGQLVLVPAVGSGLFYSVSSLTIPQGVGLVGTGWWLLRDNLGAFGTAGWSTRTNYGGSVIVFTAASGNAVSATSSATSTGAYLANLLLVGPGSGTAQGLRYGDGLNAIVGTRIANVCVGNFSTGVTFADCEEVSIYDFRLLGCNTAGSIVTNTNNCTWYGLDVQKSANPLTLDTTCFQNVFIAPIFQANTGQSFKISGPGNRLINAWIENPAGTAPSLEIVNGGGNIIDNGFFGNAADQIKVDAAASNTLIISPSPIGSVVITNAGVKTTIIGSTTNLTDTGSGTTYIDANLQNAQLAQNALFKLGAVVPGSATFTITDTTNARVVLQLKDAGLVGSFLQLYPGAEAGGQQQTGGLLHSTGVPSNSNGNNNDWAISDNGHFYFKTAGAWAQKV